MSSLSNLPYGKILDYWFERLKGRKNRYKFVFTKAIEIYAFTRKKANVKRTSKNLQRITATKNKDNQIKNSSKIIVVIPAFVKNDFDLNFLRRLIEQLTTQTRKITEILVIDDYSPVNYQLPKSIIKIRQEKNSGPLSLIHI